MHKKMVANHIEIHAPASLVWQILTEPEYTQQYMFGCSTVTNWQIDSKLDWVMQYEGKEMIPVTGFIIDLKPGRLLKYSVIDPNAAYAQTPENHLHVTYVLDENLGTTVLTVTQDHFEDAADAEKRYNDVYNNGEGWNPILQQIKTIAEQQHTR